MSGARLLWIVALLVVATSSPARASDDAATFDRLGKEYAEGVRPLLQKYCLKCHSTELQEGELDLERFSKFEQVRREPRVWQKVVEMIDNGEMPPKKKPQPSGDERTQVRGWVERYLDAEALASAGRSRPRRAEAIEQRRVRQHHPRSHRVRPPPGS